jgi:cytochrome c oxidase assembly factor CtaG
VELTLDPGVLASIALAEGLYLRALGVLRGRGVRVPGWQVAAWHAGMALWVIGLVSPIDAGGEDGLTMHMVQHLLIADLGAPLLLAGIRNPVLVFLLPRPVLVALARRRRLRAAFRKLREPLVAVPVYAGVLYLWHFPFMFEAAVRHDLVHAIQHGSFIGIGILVWWALLEPKKRRLRGELWKIPHILAARVLGMFLGMAFVITRTPLYTDVYGTGKRGLGLEAVADQQTAGGIMIVVDILIMFGSLCFFFWRASADNPEGATSP